MLWLVPLVEDVGNLSLATRTSLEATKDEIVSDTIINLTRLVRVNAVVGGLPRVHQLPNRTRNERRQVTHDVSRVTATKHNLIIENEVGANERRITCGDTCTKRFVVRVAEAHDCANVITMLTRDALDLEQAEVALTEAVERVMLIDNLKLGVVNCITELRHKRIVSDWMPTLGRLWSRNLLNVSEGHFIGSANAKVKKVAVSGVVSIDVHSIYIIDCESTDYTTKMIPSS